MQSASSARKSNGIFSSVIFPASIFERSRMSFSNESSEYAQRCAVWSCSASSGAQLAVQRDVQHPDDAVHRRPQLVRDIGQKLALGLVGCLRRAHGFFQLIGAVFDSLFEQSCCSRSAFCEAASASIMPLKLSPRNSTSSPVLLTWMGSSRPFRADVMPACSGAAAAPASEW